MLQLTKSLTSSDIQIAHRQADIPNHNRAEIVVAVVDGDHRIAFFAAAAQILAAFDGDITEAEFG